MTPTFPSDASVEAALMAYCVSIGVKWPDAALIGDCRWEYTKDKATAVLALFGKGGT